jgi:hypothetical protein
MKLIGVMQGYATLRAAPEEYQPERGVVYDELIQVIVERYSFQGFPRFAPGTTPPPMLNFVGGKFSEGDLSFAISQLALYPHGIVVIATNTEQAEIVLKDLVIILNQKLGYRLVSLPSRKNLLSNVVVEFDRGLESYIDMLARISYIINDARTGKPPFNIKRLAFGKSDVEQTIDPILAVENSDFLIERRQGAPYEINRYFSSAPMSTSDHLRVLEQIEAIA